ncbi:MAG: hypothetical protein WBD08_07355 [Candidatus Acidiferrales bacterium]
MPVPQRQRQAQQLVAVAESRDAVLAPAIRLAARVVVGEVGPGGAVGAVVFADGAPGALADVWAPAAPRADACWVGRLGEAFRFFCFGLEDCREGRCGGAAGDGGLARFLRAGLARPF